MDSKSTLAGLPVELREEIILHLGTNDLLALSGTNKEFFKLCTAPSYGLQTPLVITFYGVTTASVCSPDSTWRGTET